MGQPLNEDPDISGSFQLFIAYKNGTKKKPNLVQSDVRRRRAASISVQL